MQLSKMLLWAGTAALSAGIMPGEPLNPVTKPQPAAPMNAQEKKNMKMMLDWYREVVYAGHAEKASKYMAENLIEHSPNINTGLAGFVDYVKKNRKPMSPIPAQMDPKPAVLAAKGDYAWFITETLRTDEKDPSLTFYSDDMELVRFEDGKIQEHWDSYHKKPGTGAVVSGVAVKPAMEYNTGKLSPEEDATLKLATAEFKDMLQRAHLQDMAPKILAADYIQHNSHFPQGRDGLVRVMSSRPGRKPEDAKPFGPEWLDPPFLTLVNGPYSMMVWERKFKDPDDPSKMANYYHYDMVRVENGMIKEHWDEFINAR